MPRFTRGQVVMLSLLDPEGQPKNDLARGCSTYYYAQRGVVVSWVDTGTVFVYQVRMDDSNVLQFSEDCLMPVKSDV
jgi:hypothetical protein